MSRSKIATRCPRCDRAIARAMPPIPQPDIAIKGVLSEKDDDKREDGLLMTERERPDPSHTKHLLNKSRRGPRFFFEFLNVIDRPLQFSHAL